MSWGGGAGGQGPGGKQGGQRRGSWVKQGVKNRLPGAYKVDKPCRPGGVEEAW